MKQMYKLYTFFCCILLTMITPGCSSEDENNSEFKMSQLVGSEWENKYEWMDEDNGDYEKGTSKLTFTSSSAATIHNVYNGKAWKYNYDLDIEEYKSYSGESSAFYSYIVAGDNIILTDQESGSEITLYPSGNKLIDNAGDRIWNLLKAGEDTDTGNNDEESSYSWSTMKGIWMEESYEAMKAEISVYESQNSRSDVYTNNAYQGNFRVFGMEFDQNGRMRELDFYMRTVYNSGYPLLKTIHTSDNKTVYWTDLDPGSYSNTKYIINGNKIYYNGQEVFEIYNSNNIIDLATNNFYVRAK